MADMRRLNRENPNFSRERLFRAYTAIMLLNIPHKIQ